MATITVFTATYNRLKTIEQLYVTLKRQTCMDFEWVVIDDGSTDGTMDYFERLIEAQHEFDIRYYRQENGGKHRAINRGLDLAKGEYFFIVDSDDYITDDCLELIILWVTTIRDNPEFAGVSGLKGYSPDKIVGKTFNGDYLDCTDLDRHRFNIIGDKSEVYKTELLKRYKFPEIQGEKFLTEAVVWNRMANDGYLVRHFNKINYICEYREDGLTKRIDQLYCDNFEGYSLFVKELLGYNVTLYVKLRAIMAYGYRGRMNRMPYSLLSRRIRVNFFLMLTLSLLGIVYKRLTLTN